jgi:hypothetical protein
MLKSLDVKYDLSHHGRHCRQLRGQYPEKYHQGGVILISCVRKNKQNNVRCMGYRDEHQLQLNPLDHRQGQIAIGLTLLGRGRLLDPFYFFTGLIE